MSDYAGLITFSAVIGALATLRQINKSREDDAYRNIKDVQLPEIDLKKFFDKKTNLVQYNEECKKLAEALHLYGAAVVRDPRFQQDENQTFLNMMEKYFAISDGVRDARPETGYQVGVTPEHVEKSRDYSEVMKHLVGENAPVSPMESRPDNKWRFFWRMNKTPEKTDFPGQCLTNIIPPEFPNWEHVMNVWGGRLMDAQYAIAEMLAVGFGFPPNTISRMLEYGPHLLAPTGSDLVKYGQKDTILAAFHSDLNYMTIHGKSRYPGLSIWTRAGVKQTVKVPEGCLLIQAGKQLEYMTGGYVLAGYHEVVVTDATLATVERKKQNGESTWRVSSTLFAHFASDEILQPLQDFDTPEARAKFPAIKVGQQVQNEIEAIKLKRNN